MDERSVPIENDAEAHVLEIALAMYMDEIGEEIEDISDPEVRRSLEASWDIAESLLGRVNPESAFLNAPDLTDILKMQIAKDRQRGGPPTDR